MAPTAKRYSQAVLVIDHSHHPDVSRPGASSAFSMSPAELGPCSAMTASTVSRNPGWLRRKVSTRPHGSVANCSCRQRTNGCTASGISDATCAHASTSSRSREARGHAAPSSTPTGYGPSRLKIGSRWALASTFTESICSRPIERTSRIRCPRLMAGASAGRGGAASCCAVMAMRRAWPGVSSGLCGEAVEAATAAMRGTPPLTALMVVDLLVVDLLVVDLLVVDLLVVETGTPGMPV